MAESQKFNKIEAERNEGQEDNEAIGSAVEGEQEENIEIEEGFTKINLAISREEYLQAYTDSLNESKYLQIRNNILHRRLADYYRKRKLDHVLKPFQGTADLESKFQQKLLSYVELKEKSERETANLRSTISAEENIFFECLEDAEKKFVALQNIERNTGTGLIYSRSGKPIAEKTISRFITLQAHKFKQASALSLKYIRARNAVAELETVVRKLEILEPGLYVYQYEQLNIDKQNYKNKIEEREDELIKNRSKCTEYNQILAHIREKMHHTEEQIDFAECDLGESEIEYINSREDLGLLKTKRNKLRSMLEAEKQRAGLLVRRDLLRDFQNATDLVVDLRKRKETLEAQIGTIGQRLRLARRNMNT